jgi:hypothetical protein
LEVGYGTAQHLDNQWPETEGYYMAQSKSLAHQFLAENGLTGEMLKAMLEEEAHRILKQVLNYAADQYRQNGFL